MFFKRYYAVHSTVLNIYLTFERGSKMFKKSVASQNNINKKSMSRPIIVLVVLLFQGVTLFLNYEKTCYCLLLVILLWSENYEPVF